MSSLDLIESFPPTQQRWEAPPVALTADAVYECERRGLEYRLPADLRRVPQFDARQQSYWNDELGWFDLLDDLLCQSLPELPATGTRPALLYARWLKSALDPLFIRGCELASVLADPSEIDRVVLWREQDGRTAAPGGLPDSTRILFAGRSLFSRLLPLFSDKAGIPHHEQIVTGPAPPQSSGRGLLDSVRPVAGGLWRRWRSSSLPRGASGGLTLLFMHAGYDMRPLLAASLARGHRCLLYDGDAVFDVTGRVPRKLAVLPHADMLDARFGEAARIITRDESPLWEWPNSWFGLPVSDLLRPGITYFIERILPELLTLTAQFLALYERTDVDYVLAPVLAQPPQFAAVDAARQIDRTQRVFIEHGDSALDASAVVLLELFQFDHYFSVSAESGEFFRQSGERHGRHVAEIHVGSYRWQANRRMRERRRWRRPPVRFADGRPTVVYAITHIVADHRYLFGDERYVRDAFYSDPWYHGLQRRIVDVLASDSRFNFVIKMFPGAAWLSGPIERYVAERGASNLHISRHPFTQWLPWADRVILDFPSTAVYETAIAGVPFLCLLYPGLALRASALDEIAPWTRWFEGQDDAQRAVAEFLDAAHLPAPELRPAGRDILETLEGLVRVPTGRAAGGTAGAGAAGQAASRP